eukprot:scaffold3767_cov114-Isochrysis_galbana.AAC.22
MAGCSNRTADAYAGSRAYGRESPPCRRPCNRGARHLAGRSTLRQPPTSPGGSVQQRSGVSAGGSGWSTTDVKPGCDEGAWVQPAPVALTSTIAQPGSRRRRRSARCAQLSPELFFSSGSPTPARLRRGGGAGLASFSFSYPMNHEDTFKT